MSNKTRQAARLRRHRRVRKHIAGTAERPRLNVFRSLTQIYAQLIDDESGQTLVAASTLDPELKEKIAKLHKTEKARLVGEAIAERAQKLGIKQVVFDRGGYRYQGRVQALAEGARQKGLEF